MKRTILAAVMAVAATLVGINSASAKHHRHAHYVSSDGGQIVEHPAGCPWRAFCGCGISVKVFGHPIKSLFASRNWFQFSRVTPAAGMVAVRNHHVMLIIDYAGGTAKVYDPNSGHHATRIHARSLAGFVTVDPHSQRFASLNRRM